MIIKKIKNIKKNQKGLTLAEGLVSLGIIVILSGIVFANYNSGNKKARVDGAALNLASDIRVLQSNAMSLKSNAGNPTLGGWGFFTRLNATGESTAYDLFSDPGPGEFSVYDQATEKVETVDLTKDAVKIKNIKGDGASLTNNWGALIVFVPPDPKIILCDDNPGGSISCNTNFDEIEITLSDKNDTYEKKVIINKAGLVDVE